MHVCGTEHKDMWQSRQIEIRRTERGDFIYKCETLSSTNVGISENRTALCALTSQDSSVATAEYSRGASSLDVRP